MTLKKKDFHVVENDNQSARVEPRVMPRFKVGDLVRIKFGCDRGCYGTVKSSGGDNGTYYGVKLNCHDSEMGYCEYELAEA